MTKVSVILPTYNEAENIVPLADALHAAITHAHEILVVDDDSPDGTSARVRSAMQEGRSWLRLETRKGDRGLTKSIWRGIELVKGQVIVWMDCDFSMPPDTVPLLLTEVLRGADAAVGSRFVPGGKAKTGSGRDSSVSIALSKLLNSVLSLVLTPAFRDWTSGFIAVRADVVREMGLRGDYGEYFMDLMYRMLRRGYRVVEVPYTCRDRACGESKTAPNVRTLLRRSPGYLRTLVKLVLLRMGMGS